MIEPIDFGLEPFHEVLGAQSYISIKMEDLHGSDLIDNLILLRFLSVGVIAEVLQNEYSIPFVWLDSDTTPKEYANVAQRYQVFFEKKTPQIMTVYVPLGCALDDAMLQIDVPNYKFEYVYIADCNHRVLTYNLDLNVLSYNLADFRPLLVIRRLVLDCNDCGGTDIHFESIHIDKSPAHRIQYRIKRGLVPSLFKMDKEMIQRVVQATVAKLSSSSASDLDSSAGVTTDIANLFDDGTCDLRLTGLQVIAGLYVDIAIQNTATTALNIDQLGFPAEDVSVIRDIATRRTGLTLVTGEMRSGKNTTIFALLNEQKKQPIRIIEYSNPVENRMEFPQANYKGDIETLKNWLRLSKKLDIDIAVINEIPNADVAFAVRDLVNSAIGVITTTHVDRVWHVPNKLSEFFGKDYKSIISQLNAVINQKMFRGWSASSMKFYPLEKKYEEYAVEQLGTGFLDFAKECGVVQYSVPDEGCAPKYRLQPLAEIVIFNDSMKSQMLNFSEMWQAEDLIRTTIREVGGTIERKLARFINDGVCSLDELRKIY